MTVIGKFRVLFKSFLILAGGLLVLIQSSCSSSTGGNPAVVATTVAFSPQTGAVGTLVTVTASAGSIENAESVSVNGTDALILSKSTAGAKILVMPGTTSGVIAVTINGTTYQTTSSFTVPTTPTSTVLQQGSKLVGTGSIGNAFQGQRVRLSADGNTAVIAGPDDNGGVGAVWVFERLNGVWTQAGNKIVPTGIVGGFGSVGLSLDISADASTIAIAGSSDNSSAGAIWIFKKVGSQWIQQGNKFVGTGAIGNARQGMSLALSADGNTIVAGGSADNSDVGAAWVFIRSGETWAQQGSKLVPNDFIGTADIGTSVSISATGNTIAVTGYEDNNRGAAWIFERQNGIWTQQGSKITPSDWDSFFTFGTWSALSADGNTLAVGSNSDDGGTGAAWIFNRSGSNWSQDGLKLVGTGGVGGPTYMGETVSLCADGKTLVIAGWNDDSGEGAAWLFKKNGSAWSQVGSKFRGSGSNGGAGQTYVHISYDCSTIILGGDNDGMGGTSTGAAWIFTL